MPDRETEVGEVGALLAIVRVPDTLPAAVGVKTMETLVVAPGGMEFRTEPLIEKFDPPEVMLALVMVRVALPGLEMSNVCEAELPTVTCPKETEEGFVWMAGWGPGPSLPAPPTAHADMNSALAIQDASKSRYKTGDKRFIA